VTSAFGLSPKPALEGVSRGGLFVYNWAVRNPEKVSAIYCESPVCDIKSWPRGKSEKDWSQLLESYGFTESQALGWKGNPVDYAERLRIPALHIVNERDRIVPPRENTAIFASRYGGPITVHHNASGPETLSGHHFPLDDVSMPVNFLLKHTPGREHLAGSGVTPRGRAYFKVRAGLRNAPSRVAFLGGSITAMPNGWRDMVCASLRKRFSKPEIECINAGIGSTGSTPGAFRLRRDVLSKGKVDLLFVEAAVNDESNGFGPREQIRGMEGIVRQARLENPEIDVVMLHFVDPAKMAAFRQGRTPEVIQNHERVAEHYGIPSIDLAREVTERIDASEFDWENHFRNLHPSPFGHTVYLRSIERLFDVAWRTPRALVLPEPLDAKSYFRGRLVNVAEVRGWDVDPQWRPSGGAATRDGFVNVPMLIGKSVEAEFRFEGTAVGVFVAAGPDAGTLEFRIDGGPVRTLSLATQWSPRLHIPWAYVLDADLAPGPHELRMRMATGAMRAAHMLVN
jgi:lysophospholipase L1-like esterase